MTTGQEDPICEQMLRTRDLEASAALRARLQLTGERLGRKRGVLTAEDVQARQREQAVGQLQLEGTANAPASNAQSITLQPVDHPAMPAAADPEASFRQTRIVITAGLVVLLIVVWFIQKRNSLQ